MKSLLLIIYSKKLFKIMKNYPLKIIVLTDFHKNYLTSLGVPISKIFTYSNPIPLKSDKINNFKKNRYVVYAGRITKEKGLENLIECWISVNLENFTLKIIGTGKMLSDLSSKYKSSNVVFLGELSNNDTLLQIRDSSAVITATKMYEGQPRLLCEASSYGVPSIYPSFGGMDEFFTENYSLSFKQFDYEDLKSKILQLQDNKKLEENGREVYKKITHKLDQIDLLNQFHKILLYG